MTLDHDRLQAAFTSARNDLLAERTSAGHWVGHLASSAVSTATAVSALSLVARHSSEAKHLGELATTGAHWLLDHRNRDGGWGDTDKSYSNIATTYLCRAALELSGLAESSPACIAAADQYIAHHGAVQGVRARYGSDKTFAVPILTNAALAGLVDWREVPPLPFECAWLPQSWYRFARLPVVSYAIPALVAIGQARFHIQPPRFAPLRWLRRGAIEPTRGVLLRMQPQSGGYLEATPLTSFVVMSLAAIGAVDHPVVKQGVQFLVDSRRHDGSWPIDTNLATWNTTLALNALANSGENITYLDCLPWLLQCQHRQRHPFTGADPGGWGWTDLSGSVPDADDTPAALLALAAWRNAPGAKPEDLIQIRMAAGDGLRWLLDLQNGNGGWPTFCRGWGKLPFDRSGSDLTAHALRALRAWLPEIERGQFARVEVSPERVRRAVSRGFRFLAANQHPGGYWLPLWFGNQDHRCEENPVYGTAKVLLAYRDWQTCDATEAQRGFKWLGQAQGAAGAWGGHETDSSRPGSIEETALAVESLLAAGSDWHDAVVRGLTWLVQRIESDEGHEAAPIGFYFAKLWYYEALYPVIFSVSALGTALRMGVLTANQRPADSRAETGMTR